MKRVPKLATILTAIALALAACGGAASGPSTSMQVTMTDFTFSPNSFTVPAGKQISLSITNNGATTHSFVIMTAGQKVDTHFTDADKAKIYWAEPQVAPGASINTSFTAPSAPGEYQIVCDIAGHFEAGMVAKLNVVQ